MHDHCYILADETTVSNKLSDSPLVLNDVATLTYEDISLNVNTSAPSFICYTGRYNPYYKETRHGEFSGIALEPARFIDAINRPEWR